MDHMKTIAFQIPEELFQRLKNHLAQEAERAGYKISQRRFLVSLIEQALSESEAAADDGMLSANHEKRSIIKAPRRHTDLGCRRGALLRSGRK